jgi:hypothetical protein
MRAGPVTAKHMPRCALAEFSGAHVIYNFCNGNCIAVSREYQHRYPDQRESFRPVFETAPRSVRETDTLMSLARVCSITFPCTTRTKGAAKGRSLTSSFLPMGYYTRSWTLHNCSVLWSDEHSIDKKWWITVYVTCIQEQDRLFILLVTIAK